MVEIESERLILRQWREDDFDDFARFYADEELARYVGGVCTRVQAWRRMAKEAGHWALRGYGNWAVEEKESGRFAGGVGLWNPEGWPEMEVGYWIVREMQGKGYATEAAIRSRDYAYEVLGGTTLVSCIHPENLPSIRVAERMGARFERMFDLEGFGPHCVYRHPGPDDLARNV